MIRGIYTSAIGMMTQMNKMDVITNNIANVDNTAFKKDEAIVQSFSEELMLRLNDPAHRLIKQDNSVGKVTLGNFINTVHTDFSSGSMKETGNNYDLAIQGEGFFSIGFKNSDGTISEKYSRDGSFTLNSNGELITKDGNYVLGENGIITIPSGDISISENGYIYSNMELVDKIKLRDFENKDTLRKYGENLFDITEETQEKPFSSKILQGHLETSNVNTVNEMVKMITTSRVYELGQKMIESQDSTLGKAVNEIAKK